MRSFVYIDIPFCKDKIKSTLWSIGMATIHCLCGYIGFGKTTIAKKLEKEYAAKRFTPDELMVELYGTGVDTDFMEKADKLNAFIWENIKNHLQNGQDVIYDAGSWGIADRKYIMEMAHKLNVPVVWHQVLCRLETAKKRTLKRAQSIKELTIDEKFFDENLKKYTPITQKENLTVIFHNGE